MELEVERSLKVEVKLVHLGSSQRVSPSMPEAATTNPALSSYLELPLIEVKKRKSSKFVNAIIT